MSGQTTKPYKKTLSGSIGSGMGSLFSPSGKKYYILEHKISSKYHKAGETQEIIVDNIELGRDSHCQVRFDESFKTVSRRHAAIVRDGEMWKLVQLSKTNTTFLNGKPVHDEWYLQNGDEIQLAVNGPKLGFITPTGKKSTVGSIGLTRRLSLFRQQALRPYKTAIATLATVLLLATFGGGYIIFKQGQQLKDNTELIARANKENLNNKKLIDEQKRLLDNQGGLIDSLKNIKARTEIRYQTINPNPNPNPNPSPNIDMSSCHPFVYLIYATPILDGKELTYFGWVGTGFQLKEGKFVTARHVCSCYYNNHYYIDNGEVKIASAKDSIRVFYELLLNTYEQQGDLSIKFKCVSPTQELTFTSKQVHAEGKYDKIHTLKKPYKIKDGEEICEIPAGTNIRVGASGLLDFAYVNNNTGKGLVANKQISSELKQGTQLYILGYPHGYGERKPIYSTATCSQDGLSDDLGGTIMVSNDNTEGGNSGGPVFIKTTSGWEVVALVSGSNYAKGRFVPIAVIP
jgi:hypothetical protein